MALELYTAPTDLPVSVDEIKSHLRIQHNDDDDLIRTFIQVATDKYQTDTDGRQLITATYKEYFDSFPDCDLFRPQRTPLVSLSSIAYVDTNGDTQTWPSAYYTVDAKSDPGRVQLAYGQVWPTTRSQVNAVTVTYVAGYGAASAVPEIDKIAIKLLVGHLYENREATAEKAMAEMPLSYCSIVQNRRTGDYPR